MDSIRKEFEAWIKTEWPKTSLNRCDVEYTISAGQYVCWEVECCWRSWRASRESMTLIIHRRRGIYPDADDYEAAIEVAGLRTEFADESK